MAMRAKIAMRSGRMFTSRTFWRNVALLGVDPGRKFQETCVSPEAPCTEAARRRTPKRGLVRFGEEVFGGGVGGGRLGLRARRTIVRTVGNGGELDEKCGAASGAVVALDAAVVLLHDAVADAESEAGAFAD